MIVREAIYAAVFAQLAAAAGFVTIERRLRHWSDVTPAEQPALFLCQKTETATVKALGAPTVWTLTVELYIYAHSSDPYRSPATILNPLIDAVETALAPIGVSAGGRALQTLSIPGMVQHVYIAGKIETDEGVLGDQAVAILPVEILCL